MFFELGVSIVYFLKGFHHIRRKQCSEAVSYFLLSLCAAGIFFVNGGGDEIAALVQQLPSGDVAVVVITPV
ncbi:hypothetical protein VSR68_30600 [Paraburkholderia phymatum]|uniref:hypothetical protein n=1 Tax=Paraburkholderia phymatum TaxID=148447 RepID=UPI00317887E8